ncbi:AraC family transcriptional regulator [Hufsiella ginkgonis]|uniref:Helix-turn-helix domain-containing protein n=1 Tax=Hufsiella ginkgonis TaxID=2695274 RepID=A0A7K1Y0A1_9SPHI|nr:helix-turn-helix domain-containing protein [Hufsiella ginkgonis]MXV16507.1 helix-turn-helix domain-containing protein [Hufsiella ginkgonis]
MVEIFQNIRYIYDFITPCEALRPFVEFYSQSSPERTSALFDCDFSVKMFASWTPTFYFNLGGVYQMQVGHQRYRVPAGHDVLILRDGIVERQNLPSDNIFTVKFHPGGLEAVLGISQVPFIDRIVPLNQVLPPALISCIKQPVTFENRAVLMEEFLLSSLRIREPDHYRSLVERAIGEYANGDMQLNTSAVAERLFVTSKTINRYFHRVVGLSPKRYFSILRARASLNAWLGNSAEFQPYDYGYYDHSHFYRDVSNFTGQPFRAMR